MNIPPFFKGEFIGLHVMIDQHIKGKIVDETKFTLVIKTPSTTRRVAKASHRFTFMVGEKPLTVEGKKLVARPHERIKW